MTEDVKLALGILAQAMEIEKNGRLFYEYVARGRAELKRHHL